MKIKNFKVFAISLASIICISAFSFAFGNTNALSLGERAVSGEPQDMLDIPHYISLKDDSRYEQKGNLIFIPEGETAGMALEEFFEAIQFIDIYGTNSYKVLEDIVVGTGFQAKIYVPQEHTVYDADTFIVLGDVNSDGAVDTSDLLKIKSSFLNAEELDVYIKIAADITEDNIVDITDYMRIKSYFLGEYNLYK